jgi:hypothetical protein
MANGVFWLSGSPSAFLNYGATVEEFVKGEVQKIMAEVMEEAAAKMREFISTRGLANSAGAGRIQSGNMLNSVGFKVNAGGVEIEGTIGWLENGEVYFLAQEEGAVLWNGGVIMPMLALYDAGQWAIEEFKSRLGAALE